VTVEKLEELKTERDRMSTPYGLAFEKASKSSNLLFRVKILHEALKSTPVAHADTDNESLEAALSNLKVLLEIPLTTRP
jgi:hypothetical protein